MLVRPKVFVLNGRFDIPRESVTRVEASDAIWILQADRYLYNFTFASRYLWNRIHIIFAHFIYYR